MKHLDLFSGIGGFALAVDEVWPGSEHIFCEIDPYCQALLKKRFEGSVIFGDIRELSADSIADTKRIRLECAGTPGGIRKESEVSSIKGSESALTIKNTNPYSIGGNKNDRQLTADTDSNGQPRQHKEVNTTDTGKQTFGIAEGSTNSSGVFILTGGFPCQPFSQAGKRRGTSDNRFLWPEMLRVIREFQPTWIIAENVRGILTIEQGMVFQQVCLGLEGEGYEVQPFIIPAVSVNAPHRRDRVWFVANRKGNGMQGGIHESWQRRSVIGEEDSNASDTELSRRTYRVSGQERETGAGECRNETTKCNWGQNWLEVATELCGMDDGLPAEVDGLKLSKSKHRVERLKALGNAIVPQVAIEIMRAIKGSL